MFIIFYHVSLALHISPTLHKIFSSSLNRPGRISSEGELKIRNAPASAGLMGRDSGNRINASWVVLGFDYLGTDPLFGITERNVASH